jgi:hypothetical protein
MMKATPSANPLQTLLFCTAVALGSTSLHASESDPAKTLEQQVDGLWLYTGLTTSEGQDMPLTGIFLFKDDLFVQQAVFDGTPFGEQRAMAHAGPVQPKADHVHLVAKQTISTSPGQEPYLTFRANTQHDVTVDRSGNQLRLVFSMGTGTVQEFERAGPGEGEVYHLADGALALVDGYFILVEGDEGGVATGYGTYQRNGNDLDIQVIRWAEADASGATNLKDTTLQATFDGDALVLADGRRFEVVAD